jgi:hypothetical protein
MRITLLLVSLLLSIVAMPQAEKGVAQPGFHINPDFFKNDKPYEITLKSNFKKLKTDKLLAPYQDAEMLFLTKDSIQASTNIQIKARGKNRKETCVFPPLQIAIPKHPENGKKAKQQKYKMVVHCNDTRLSETAILKEFLCYKLYQCITERSFNIRLIRVKYIDTGTQNAKETVRFAFLIENLPDLAKRLGSKVEKNEKLSQLAIQKDCMLKLAMFQFMIGNFDWGVPTQRNLKLLRPETNLNEIYAVPYDFDYCGLVNAYYAFPAEELKISSVRDRIYLGHCLPFEELEPVIEEFKVLKDKFYHTIDSFGHIDNSTKKEMKNYLEEFYKMIGSKGFYKNHILNTCKDLQ